MAPSGGKRTHRHPDRPSDQLQAYAVPKALSFREVRAMREAVLRILMVRNAATE